jgi:hypothetical protein
MKLKIGIVAACIGLLVVSCGDKKQEVELKEEVTEVVNVEPTEAEQLVIKAIEAHGGDKYNPAHYSFKFRESEYWFKNEEANYRYERKEKKENGEIHQSIIENGEFTYIVNDKVDELSDEDKDIKMNSLNSVIYFAALPYKLRDPSVQVDYKGQMLLNDTAYQLVFITFNKKDGGKDYQDEYLYWFNEANGQLDYLAYSFIENDGGTRFRKAINKRRVDEVLFQDYINYKGEKGVDLYQLAEQYERGELKELSRIELVEVKSMR